MKIERKPLRDPVCDAIYEMIVSGRLADGDRLAEESLAHELGVSRTPVREALLSLEREELLRFEMNKGFRVAPLDETTVEELYPIIGTLEGLAVRLSDQARDGWVERLRRINGRIRPGLPSQRLYRLDLEWHRELLSCCRNRRLSDLVSGLRRTTRRYDGASQRGLANVELSTRQHEEIELAIEQRRLGLACERLEAHWKDGVETVLGWLRREGKAK